MKINVYTLILGTRVEESALPRLLGILSPVVHSWSLFAGLIGVPSSQITLIEAANPHPSPSSLYNCFGQSLEWWIANHHDPTYETILAVLDPKWGETTPLMNRDLAKQVKDFMAKERGELVHKSHTSLPKWPVWCRLYMHVLKMATVNISLSYT